MSDVLTRGLLRRRATISLPAYDVVGAVLDPLAFRTTDRFDRSFRSVRQNGDRIGQALVYHVMEPADDCSLLGQFKLQGDAKLQIVHLAYALAWCLSADGEDYLPQLPPGQEVRLIAYVPTYLGVLQKVEATRIANGFELDTFAITETHEALGEREWSPHTYLLARSPALADI